MNVTPETVIVEHSLGTITIVDFLLEIKKEPKAIVLVGGYTEFPLVIDNILDIFKEK